MEKSKSSPSLSTTAPNPTATSNETQVSKDKGKSDVLPTSQPNPYTKPFPLKCFKCQQPGHRSNECPLRRQVGLLGGNDHNDDYYSECGDEFAEAELVLGDDGDSVVCILQKLLFAPK